MGGLPCAKAAIDGPGTLGAAAAAAVQHGGRYAAGECAALVEVVRGFAMAFPFIYDVLEEDGAEDDIKAGLALSYKMCDWAKLLKAGVIGTDVVAWRAEITGWLNSMVEKYMPDEYRVK